MMLYTSPECSHIICPLLSSEEHCKVFKKYIVINFFIDEEVDLSAFRLIAPYGLTGELKEANNNFN